MRLRDPAEERTVLRLLAGGPKDATYEADKIVFEDGTEVSRPVMGYLCNTDPPLVKGTIRWSADDEIVGYTYELTAAGHEVLVDGSDENG